MKYNLKQSAQAVKGDAGLVLRNLDHLIEAASLLIVSIFSYLVITHKVDGAHLNTGGRYVVTGACLVIGFRGAIEFLRYLANK
jgi:hypothetical protein